VGMQCLAAGDLPRERRLPVRRLVETEACWQRQTIGAETIGDGNSAYTPQVLVDSA
jgi:hypothetical protein